VAYGTVWDNFGKRDHRRNLEEDERKKLLEFDVQVIDHEETEMTF